MKHSIAILLLAAAPVFAQAPYVLPDGSIQIIAAAPLAATTRALDDLYLSSHSATHFTLRIGDNYSAMAALTFDRSLVAPLGSEYTRVGLGDNLKIAAEPLPIRIAHATLTPGSGVPALGVIVHPSNPLIALSLPQLTRIFALGAPLGDLTMWSQLGVRGPLASRLITPIGPLRSDELDSEDPQAGEFLSLTKFASLNMNHRYVALPRYAEIIRRVAEDPAAIAITALNQPLPGVKVLPLQSSASGAPHFPFAAEIASGHYPLDRFVYLYVRLGKGKPADPLALDYARLALSDAGQRAIAAQGYIPLSVAELAQERARLDQ